MTTSKDKHAVREAVAAVPDREGGCNCRLCKEATFMGLAYERRDPDELIAIIEDIRERLACSEMDNDVHDAIMAGEWPSAEE